MPKRVDNFSLIIKWPASPGGQPEQFTVEKKDSGMATNPVGKDTKKIRINMRKKMSDTLEERARSMHLSTSKYCKVILSEWVASGKKLKLAEK